MNPFAAVLRKVGDGLAILRIIRGPLLVSVFAALVLSLLDQSHEVYRIIADEWAASWAKSDWFAPPMLRVVSTFLFLVFVSFGVLVSTTDIALGGIPEQDGLLKRFLLRLLLLLPALLISVGLAAGLMLAALDLQAIQYPPEALIIDQRLRGILDEANRPVWWLRAGAIMTFLVTAVALSVLILDARFKSRARSRTWVRTLGPRNRKIARINSWQLATLNHTVLRDPGVSHGTASVSGKYVLFC